MAPVREQINGLLRDAIPPLGPDWSAQIADMLNTGSRRDLFTLLDRFDEVACEHPDLDALLPDDPDTATRRRSEILGSPHARDGGCPQAACSLPDHEHFSS